MSCAASVTLSRDPIRRRVNAYAEWVSRLRRGEALKKLRTSTSDPFAPLAVELRNLAEALDRQERELCRLFDFVSMPERAVSLDEVLNQIFDRFFGLITFDRIGCAFLSGNGTYVTAHWARSALGPQQIATGYSQPLAESGLERILQTAQPRILDDLESYLEANPQSDSTRRIVLEGGRSSFTCPLIVDHRPVGFLFFTSREKNAYSRVRQSVLREIANQISAVIDSNRTYLQFIERNMQLIEEGRKLAEAATHDALTGILNRGAILRAADMALTRSAQNRTPAGFIMIDIDHFKEVNDRFGHAAGDLTLKEFTRRMTATIRQSDQFGRLGGEEFLIVAPDVRTRVSLDRAAERLRSAIIAAPFAVAGQSLRVSASFGAMLATGGGQSVQQVIAAADHVLYEAKSRGRDCVVVDELRAPAEVAVSP